MFTFRSISTFKNNLMVPLIFYLFALFFVFILIWILLWLAVPEVELNMLNAISTAFGLELPERLLKNYSITTLFITFIVIIVAVVLMLINVTFEAVVTERLINPKVDIYTSENGVLSSTWNEDNQHILIRLLNFHHLETLDISVKCVLAVHEKFEKDIGETDEFICYFPIKELTPEGILLMQPRMPWTIAIPLNQPMANSINPDYKLQLEDKKIPSFRPKSKTVSICRTLELMITGIEPKSYANFVKYKSIPIDRSDKYGYQLLLHRGSFKSLPLHVSSKEEVEHYV